MINLSKTTMHREKAPRFVHNVPRFGEKALRFGDLCEGGLAPSPSNRRHSGGKGCLSDCSHFCPHISKLVLMRIAIRTNSVSQMSKTMLVWVLPWRELEEWNSTNISFLHENLLTNVTFAQKNKKASQIKAIFRHRQKLYERFFVTL